MATKKKDGKKKKKDGGRASRLEPDDDHEGDEKENAESMANFQEEYTKFCKKFGATVIPEITKREPSEEGEEEDSKKKRKKSKKDKEVARTESVAASKSEGTTGAGSTQGETGEAAEEPPPPPPPPPVPTPTVFVTYEDPKKNLNPNSLCFEAICMENALLGALGECLKIFKTITNITIRRCYLPGEHVLMLGEILRVADTVTELTIDGCPQPGQYFHVLVRDGRSLELLTLRGCKIDDDVVNMIALELSFKEDFKDAATLFYLNLSVNMISDRGARLLAKALRTNRTLLALTLTCNLITDVGAIALANVLKDFDLIDDEVLDRRNHIYHRYKTYMSMREELLEQMKARESCDSTGPANKDKNNVKTHGNSPTQRRKTKVHLNMNTQIELWKQVDDVPGIHHPFVQDGFPSNKKLWCSGNMRLSHLNLSYNSITQLSVEKFLQVVAYQSRLQKVSPLSQYGQTGLTNLILQGNLFPIDCAEMSQINGFITDMNPAGSDQSLVGETATSLDRTRRNSKI